MVPCARRRDVGTLATKQLGSRLVHVYGFPGVIAHLWNNHRRELRDRFADTAGTWGGPGPHGVRHRHFLLTNERERKRKTQAGVSEETAAYSSPISPSGRGDHFSLVWDPFPQVPVQDNRHVFSQLLCTGIQAQLPWVLHGAGEEVGGHRERAT